MNKYQEAMKVYEEACNREGYDYRGTIGCDLGLDEIKPLIQELVDGFSKIGAEIERIKTSRVPSTDYSDGYLAGLKDALSILGEKEGK